MEKSSLRKPNWVFKAQTLPSSSPSQLSQTHVGFSDKTRLHLKEYIEAFGYLPLLMPSKYQPLHDSDDLDQIPSSSRLVKGKKHVQFVLEDGEDEEGPSLTRYTDDQVTQPRSSDPDLSFGVGPPLKSTLRSREAGECFVA